METLKKILTAGAFAGMIYAWVLLSSQLQATQDADRKASNAYLAQQIELHPNEYVPDAERGPYPHDGGIETSF
jgi:hypothetical protein